MTIIQKNELKKGVSELVAAVLLIGIVVAVAVVISIWLMRFTSFSVETTKEKAEIEVTCPYGRISLYDVSFCNSYIAGKIKNVGMIGLGNISLQLLYSDSAPQFGLCEIGNIISNCSIPNLFVKSGLVYPFNFSIDTGSNFDQIRVFTNCTNVDDYVPRSDVATC